LGIIDEKNAEIKSPNKIKNPSDKSIRFSNYNQELGR